MARKMRLMKDLGTSALIGMLMVLSLWIATPWQRDHALAEDGVAARGQVALPDCPNHATYIYRFDVNGREYRGRGGAGMKCQRLRVGDPMSLWYLRTDPSINSDTEPRAALRANERSFAIMAIAVPIGVFVMRRVVRFLSPYHFPARPE
jgi:hypothetical protein